MYSVLYMQRGVKGRSCNRKAKRITYSEGVYVALGIEHAMSMRHIVNCGLPSYTIYFHINS